MPDERVKGSGYCKGIVGYGIRMHKRVFGSLCAVVHGDSAWGKRMMENEMGESMKSWKLKDAQKIAQEHKYTFFRPSDKNIAKVVPGENVQLIFEFESNDPQAPSAERMWVKVDHVDGQGGFRGTLNNTPQYIKDLKYNDDVSFNQIHIIQTEHKEEVENDIVQRYLSRCYVTRRVLYDGYKVGYLVRQEPESEEESGWCMMAGDESEEYMQDAKNICYVSLGAVLNEDDEFVDLLASPVGSEYEWDDASEKFVLVQSQAEQ